MRSDLPTGVAAAQVAHAAGESSPGNLQSGTFAIVLSVPTEVGLRAVAANLAAAGLECVEITEPDAPYDGQLMAIGVRPVLRSRGRKVLSNLPLYRGSTSGGVAQMQSARKRDGGSHPSSPTISLWRKIFG